MNYVFQITKKNSSKSSINPVPTLHVFSPNLTLTLTPGAAAGERGSSHPDSWERDKLECGSLLAHTLTSGHRGATFLLSFLSLVISIKIKVRNNELVLKL